ATAAVAAGLAADALPCIRAGGVAVATAARAAGADHAAEAVGLAAAAGPAGLVTLAVKRGALQARRRHERTDGRPHKEDRRDEPHTSTIGPLRVRVKTHAITDLCAGCAAM